MVTDLILAETHLHVLYALGPVRAADHLGTLETDPSIEEVHMNATLQRSALSQWIRRFSDQAFTLTDAVSFAVVRERGIDSAFSFDDHFRIAGFDLLPEGS